MNRLCFGGSFNPVHHGHLRSASAVAEHRGYGQVVLIPSKRPPHKTHTHDVADAFHRLAMCRLAAEEQPLFHVSSIELTLPGPSYSIHTVRALKSAGWDRVDWLIGADQLMSLPSWHEAEKLIEEVRFIVMARPGHRLDWARLPQRYQSLRENVVVAPLVDVSGTDIRRRVAAGQPIDALVPAAVAAYIAEHGLYRRTRLRHGSDAADHGTADTARSTEQTPPDAPS